LSKNDASDLPGIISGELFTDDRGEVAFVNNFKLDGVKRFYLVSNHKSGFVRAWHAHRREAKYVIAVEGAALVGTVRVDNWENPSKHMSPSRFVLTSKNPSVLRIPAGYAHGFMSLTENCKLIFFSTSTLEESKSDDIRFNSRYWDIWNVIER
jgi:dTDP-4-dehydrorhamnose 3,5-epimerase